jgi:hypothetical protein
MAARQDCTHVIPLLTPDLVQLLAADPGVGRDDRALLPPLAHSIGQVYHRHLHRRLSELKNAYAPFDPDSDAVTVRKVGAQERQHRLNELLSDLAWLLDRAHFRHLSREEIEPMLESYSDWGIRMQVDFSAFEHCALFARGDSHQTRTLCSWKTLWREREVELPIFRRLVLILKLRPGPKWGPKAGTEGVFLKIFKDIPRADVDMLLPGSKVRLKLLDRGKIGAGLLSGLGTMAWRLQHDLINLVQQFILSDSALWGLTAGTLGYGYKSYYDYRTTQQAYHLSLTQSLYFQCLDSNAGVLTRLFDEAEEQETRMALLAYFCLWRFAGPGGFTSEELEAAMELYLDRYAGVTVLCAAGEPAAKLVRLGVAKEEASRYRALPLAEATAALVEARALKSGKGLGG